jgi:hypothetical protein
MEINLFGVETLIHHTQMFNVLIENSFANGRHWGLSLLLVLKVVLGTKASKVPNVYVG